MIVQSISKFDQLLLVRLKWISCNALIFRRLNKKKSLHVLPLPYFCLSPPLWICKSRCHNGHRRKERKQKRTRTKAEREREKNRHPRRERETLMIRGGKKGKKGSFVSVIFRRFSITLKSKKTLLHFFLSSQFCILTPELWLALKDNRICADNPWPTLLT